MGRIFRIFVTGVLVLSLVSMGMGAAIAQDGGTRNGNESTDDQDELEADAIEGNETDAIESAAIVQERNRTIQFGEWTELIGWGFENGTLQVAIDTERQRDVVIVDSVAGFGEEGAVRPPTSETSLEAGTHVVTMPVESFRGANSVTVNIEGASVRLSSEIQEREPDDPLQYFGGMSGLFWGIGMTVGLSACAAGYVVYREDSGVIKA